MRCPRWLGLHTRGLGGPPDLKQVPHSRKEASGKDASADLSGQKTHSLLASPSSPEHMSGDEANSEDEIYTASFTSHTTASDSTTVGLLTSSASAMEDNGHVQPLNISPTESQFTCDMPHVEGSTQLDQTTDSVFIQQPSDSDSSNSQSSIPSSPVSSVQRRSTRSTKGAPPVQFGKVTHSAIISKWLLSVVGNPCMCSQSLSS